MTNKPTGSKTEGINVARIAVDEPAEGESGTIYEYEVRAGQRVMFTTYNEADANDAAFALKTLPLALDVMRGMLQRHGMKTKNGAREQCPCVDCFNARAIINKAEGI